jgi:hypothetical protein
MSMSEEHKYIDKDGYEWTRIFHIPQSSIDTKIDIFSQKEFVEKTRKRGSLGDAMDRSKELSLKRAEKCGKDPIKESYYEKYSKRRNGCMHPDKVKERAKNKLEKMGVIVENN